MTVSPAATARALKLQAELGSDWPAFECWLAMFGERHAADISELLERDPDMVIEQFRRQGAEHPSRPWGTA
jgi:hypothetical protein